jgi:dihydrofolate synthase/folylpolyglutamate synthase
MIIASDSKQRENSTKNDSSKSYNEVVLLLSKLKKVDFSSQAPQRLKLLDELCSSPSEAMDIILVGGLSGRSTTIYFSSKLLTEEGFKIGSCYSSSLLTYNERICISGTQISNKDFTKIAAKVLDLVEARKIDATELEVIIAVALIYFKAEGVHAALISTGIGGKHDCTAGLNPKIMALTKVSNNTTVQSKEDEIDKQAFEIMGAAKPDCWFVSAEQSKIRLQKMKTLAEKEGFFWAMPIRKLAPLPYIFEQLYGKYASLAERIAQIYSEEIKQKFSPFLRGNLLATQKGQRGRPTLEAKREAELHPVKNLKNFWTDNFELLRGQFELIDKEKPSVLLDTAASYDSFANLFLGIRLLHYRRPLKGLAMIITIKNDVDPVESLKQLRYLLKKIQGEAFFISLPGQDTHKPHELAQIAREMNIRANVSSSLKDAFDAAKLIVDERGGIVCITGCKEIVSDYWKNVREVKKL